MRPSLPGRPSRRPVRALLVVLLVPAGAATGAERNGVVPAIEWLETWTSNATGVPDGKPASSDLMTAVTPRLLADWHAPSSDLHADLGLRRSSYARHSAPDETDRLVDASARFVPITDLLSVEAAADERRVNQSLLAPQSSTVLPGNPNQSVARSWRVDPALDWRIGSVARNSLRVGHSDYASDAAGGAFDVRSDRVDERLSSGPQFSDLSGSLQLFHQRYQFRGTPDSSESRLLASGDLRVDGALHAIGAAGHERYELPDAASATSGSQWRAGLRWQPSPLDTAEATVGHRFFGRTWNLELAHHGRRTFATAHYGTEVVTTQLSFQLPAGAAAEGFLANLLAPTVSDTATRNQLAHNLATELHLGGPFTAANAFATTATYRERRLELQGGYHSALATLALAAFSEARSSLSSLQQGGLGDFASSPEIHDSGMTLSGSLHPDARTTVSAGLQASRAGFDRIGRTDHQLTFSAGAARALDHQSSLALEATHQAGDSNASGNSYHQDTIQVSFVHRF